MRRHRHLLLLTACVALLVAPLVPARAATEVPGSGGGQWTGTALAVNPTHCFPLDNPACDRYPLTLGTPDPQGFCHCVYAVSVHGWSTLHLHAESEGCRTPETQAGTTPGCWIAVYARDANRSPASVGQQTDRARTPLAQGWGDVWMGAAQGYYDILVGSPATVPSTSGIPAATFTYRAWATLICQPLPLGC